MWLLSIAGENALDLKGETETVCKHQYGIYYFKRNSKASKQVNKLYQFIWDRKLKEM